MFRLPIIATDETGQRHGPFAIPIVDKLLSTGVMWQDAYGEYHILAENVDICALNPHISVCDICTAQPVTWDADVGDFHNFDPRCGPFAHFHSAGGYYLCEPCGQHVLAGDRVALRRRQMREFMKRWSVGLTLDECVQMRVLMEEQAEQVHQQFWQHYRSIKRIDK